MVSKRDGNFLIKVLSKRKAIPRVKNTITVMKLGPRFLIISTFEKPFLKIYSGNISVSLLSSSVFSGREFSIIFSVGIILKDAIS